MTPAAQRGRRTALPAYNFDVSYYAKRGGREKIAGRLGPIDWPSQCGLTR